MFISRGYDASSKLVGIWTVASVLLVCSLACSRVDSSVASLGSASNTPVTLTIGFPYPTVEDPLHGVRQAARLASLEGLTAQNLDGRPVPRLAEGWSKSSDGLTWLIRLRPTALFHDGSPVDADAVRQSLQRYLAGGASRFSPGLEGIASIEASQRYVLTIRLRHPSTLLLDDLDTPITKIDKDNTEIGTGPYVVSSTTANEVVMTAFPQYYRGIATIKRLVWRPYPTVRTAWAAAMRGDVDFLYEVGPETREFLQAETSVELYKFLRAYVFGIVFNARRQIFEDAEVRRALNYAVDREKIVAQAFRGYATAASGPAWPLHWAYDESAPQYSYDPARAAASLRKALSSRKTSFQPNIGANAREGTALKFVCLIPENFQLWERVALMVQRNLAEIGVAMELESVPANQFNLRIAQGNFDVVLIEMVSGTSVSRPYFFWRSLGLSNFSAYSNPLVDSALEQTRHAASDDEYRKAFSRFQRATFDDPPAMFLAWGETARAVSRRFNVVKAPGGDIRMTISDWTLASEAAN